MTDNILEIFDSEWESNPIPGCSYEVAKAWFLRGANAQLKAVNQHLETAAGRMGIQLKQ